MSCYPSYIETARHSASLTVKKARCEGLRELKKLQGDLGFVEYHISRLQKRCQQNLTFTRREVRIMKDLLKKHRAPIHLCIRPRFVLKNLKVELKFESMRVGSMREVLGELYTEHRCFSDGIAGIISQYATFCAFKGERVFEFKGHCGMVRSVVVFNDGGLVARGDCSGHVWVRDAATGECKYWLSFGRWGIVRQIEYIGKNRLLICVGNKLYLWSLDTNQRKRVFMASTHILCTSLSRYGVVQVASVSKHSALVSIGVVVDDDDNDESSIKNHAIVCPSNITCMALSCDGKDLVVGCEDNIIRTTSASLMHLDFKFLEFVGHTSTVTSVQMTADKSRIISASRGDETLRVWNAKSGDCLRVHRHYGGAFCRDICLYSDDQHIARVVGEFEVQVLNLETGDVVRTFSQYSELDPIQWMGCCGDKQLITVSMQAKFLVWR